ncbi:MAG TPA: hypothetical protein VGG03_24025 [Thermoanaerobaculia bacterium]|jgi:hypothetical protein
MDSIQVETHNGANAFLPGEIVEGVASWQLDRPAETIELRLFWYTEGKGDRDVQVVETVSFPNPGAQERRGFRVHLPEGPYSFSGKLISLAWALEVVAEPGSRAGRLPIVVSPTRREILLHPAAAAAAEPHGAGPG